MREKTISKKIKRNMVNIYESGMLITLKDIEKVKIVNYNRQLFGYLLCLKGEEIFLSKDVKFEAFCTIDISPYKSNFIKAPKRDGTINFIED